MLANKQPEQHGQLPAIAATETIPCLSSVTWGNPGRHRPLIHNYHNSVPDRYLFPEMIPAAASPDASTVMAGVCHVVRAIAPLVLNGFLCRVGPPVTTV
jgi:hypothetical protein